MVGNPPPRRIQLLTLSLPRANIIDYADVLERMRADGFESLYHNSGAFGFPGQVSPRHVGWIGPPDPTIRPAATAFTRQIPPPFEQNLAQLATRAWRELVPGPVWVMPKSHWAYELDFGSSRWMPRLLEELGLDPASLHTRHDGTALEFHPQHTDAFSGFLAGLLGNLIGSDFALAFPGRPVVCSVHHHKQLWWSTTDDRVHAALDAIVPVQKIT